MDGWSVGTAVKLAVVEVLDRDGHVRSVVPVWRWPVTIGRAVDCDVVLDDVHAAPRHAMLEDLEGGLSLRAHDSINRVRVMRRTLAPGESVPLPPGEIVHVGATRLRVRRASDTLAPEQPLVPEPAANRIPIPLLLLAFTAWSLGEHWLGSNPGGKLTDYLPPLLAPPLLVAAWAGLWAVGSKLFRHRFDFMPHARVALGYSLLASAVWVVLPVAAFSLGWPLLSHVSGLAAAAAVAAMVFAHLTLMLPSRRRRLAIVTIAVFASGTVLYLVRNSQTLERPFDQLYVTVLPPPVLRVAPAIPTERFIEEARSLKARVDRHVEDEQERR